MNISRNTSAPADSEGLPAHEQCVVSDLSRLLNIKNQSPIDALRDFERIVKRIDPYDYSSAGRVALLGVALEIPAKKDDRCFYWDISGMLGVLEQHGVLPDLSSPAGHGVVGSAFQVPAFRSEHLGWLLDRGVRVDVKLGSAMPLIFLSIAWNRRDLFDEMWARFPNPALADERGYSLLACSLSRTSEISDGFWKPLVESGMRFHDPCPNGKTPASMFEHLARFPGVLQGVKGMKEVAMAIEAEALALATPSARSSTPKSRL